ncbi:hypothetical protein [Plantactinospora sp. CA-290183]
MIADTCPCCGRSLSLRDRQVRFTLPEPVLDAPAQEETAGTWATRRPVSR